MISRVGWSQKSSYFEHVLGCHICMEVQGLILDALEEKFIGYK
jgi:hypothetical protein